MTRRHRLRAVAAGLLAGLAGGLLGVGGGLVLIPLLTGSLGLSQHQAHGTSLAVIGVAALASLAVYGAHADVAWLTAALVAAASLATAGLGARWAARTSPQRLARAFAGFMVVVGARLLWKIPDGAAAVIHQGVPGAIFDIVLGLTVGLLSGYMGVGGGVLVVPALTLLLGMPQRLAQGTSLAVIVAAAPAGAIEHARQRNVIWPLVPSLALGAVIGGPLASWLAQHTPQALLTRAFALFMLANAAHTWVRAAQREGRADRGPLEPGAA